MTRPPVTRADLAAAWTWLGTYAPDPLTDTGADLPEQLDHVPTGDLPDLAARLDAAGESTAASLARVMAWLMAEDARRAEDAAVTSILARAGLGRSRATVARARAAYRAALAAPPAPGHPSADDVRAAAGH